MFGVPIERKTGHSLSFPQDKDVTEFQVYNPSFLRAPKFGSRNEDAHLLSHKPAQRAFDGDDDAKREVYIDLFNIDLEELWSKAGNKFCRIALLNSMLRKMELPYCDLAPRLFSLIDL